MVVTEEARHKLYNRLDQVLGHEEATTLMDHLPQGGWANLATKDDVAALQRDIAAQAAATKDDIADVKRDIAAQAAATKRDIGDVKNDIGDVRNEIASVRTATRNDMDARFELMSERFNYAIGEVRQEIQQLGLFLRADLHKTILHYSIALLSLIIAGVGAAGTFLAIID